MWNPELNRPEAINEYVYLDYNATTPVDPRVAQVLYEASLKYLNPSSIHPLGSKARKALEEARDKIASILNIKPSEILFTSGGTEANNIAIQGIAYSLAKRGKKHLITSSIEHASVKNTFKKLEEDGFQVTYLPVSPEGIVDLEALKDSLRDDTALVSVMWVNNEIGTIQPVKEIVDITKERSKAYVHIDGVQALGKLKIDLSDLGADLVSFSAHKIYGPKGVGMLYVKTGVPLRGIFGGGDQEKGLRPGTENLPGILAFAKALEIMVEEMDQYLPYLKQLRDRLEEKVLSEIPESRVYGKGAPRVPTVSGLGFYAVEGEALLSLLGVDGFCVSSRSACSSRKLEPSHVLLAMGVPHEWAHGSIRVSLGKYVRESDIDSFLSSLKKAVERLREISPIWRAKSQV